VEYLRKEQTATVRELARALGMTGANVRHHLVVLEGTDLIEVRGQRREGRGRPVNVYGLSRRVLGDALDELSHALLEEWLAALSEGKREVALAALGRRLAAGGAGEAGLSLTGRLALTVTRLNELRYQARWEAGPAGPRLILGHCPYAAIIEKHPELCRMDSYLLQERLSQAATQTAKLERSPRGQTFCAFIIG
jgi:predicted ArsR family transcriptional regulator